jgi:hypothetical protein
MRRNDGMHIDSPLQTDNYLDTKKHPKADSSGSAPLTQREIGRLGPSTGRT